MAHQPTSLTSFERPRELLVAAGILALACTFFSMMVFLGPRSELVLDGLVWLALPLLLVIWVAIRRLFAAGTLWVVSVPDIVALLGTYAWCHAALASVWGDFFGVRMLLLFLATGAASVYVWQRHPYARTRAALWGAFVGMVLGLGLGAWLPGMRAMIPVADSRMGQFVSGLASAYVGGITVHAWVVAVGDEVRKRRASANHQRSS